MPPFLGALLALAAFARAQQPVPTPAEIEAEVQGNVLGQPLGEGTVADLALPEEFVRRVADRIVRSSYEERYRIVVEAEEPVGSGPVRDPLETGEGSPGPPAWIALAAAAGALVAVAAAAFLRRGRRGTP